MKDRPTVLIFTDMDSINTASALKEEMLIAEPDAVVIIIDALELYANTLKDFVEKVFGIPANLKKRLAHLKEKLISRHVDDVGVYDNVMKPKESYKRMLNIVNRYMPGLVVSVGFGAFTEAVAVRDSGKTEPFRVVSYIPDYALNRQLVNSYLDGYVVATMGVKTSLVNSKIPEDKVIAAKYAVAGKFFDGITREAALKIMKLPSEKPVITLVAYSADDLKIFDGVDLSSVTPLCYCGENREAYSKSIDYGFYAYNEGTSAALIYAASDAVITPPEAYYTQAAFKTGKIVALTAPRDNLEKLNFRKLSPYTESVTDNVAVVNFLRKLVAGELIAAKPPEYGGDAGKALLSFAFTEHTYKK